MKKFIIPFIFIGLFNSCMSQSENKVEVGSLLPKFTLKDDKGEDYSPSQWVGKKYVVIYFYPKDDTPGCTKESCSFRDNKSEFDELDAVIIGISADGQKSHTKFKEKYNLTYTLLSDTNKEARKIFGVPSTLLGMIPGRVTYIFDKNGECIQVINSQTNPEKHINESLEMIKKHMKS
jgi:peroxiredoxin Q/BCP